MLHFDSDYMRGAHPEIMRRLAQTNLEQTVGYGCDEYCKRAKELLLRECELTNGYVAFLVGGTQVNSAVIDALLLKHQGVIAVESGHINVHEAGAIEACGHKVLTLPQHDGKLDAAELNQFVHDFYSDESYQHMVAPGMVYITHATECGSIYTLSELRAISAVCARYSLLLYLDGARLGYGLMSQGCDLSIKDIAHLCDAFTIGGTKQGALFGEALVSKRPALFEHFFPLVKQHGALLAKGRLLGIQFETLFTDGLYYRIASSAVQKAMRLRQILLQRGHRLFFDSPSNQQFFILPNSIIDQLLPHASFELWGPRGAVETPVRFVCDWATTDEEIDQFAQILDGLGS